MDILALTFVYGVLIWCLTGESGLQERWMRRNPDLRSLRRIEDRRVSRSEVCALGVVCGTFKDPER